MSQDGKRRFDLRITHRVGAQRLSDILCYKHSGDDDDGVESLPDYSRAAILRIARHQLAMNADAPNWWTDHIEEDWITELRQWADVLVCRRFPELNEEERS